MKNNTGIWTLIWRYYYGGDSLLDRVYMLISKSKNQLTHIFGHFKIDDILKVQNETVEVGTNHWNAFIIKSK